METEITETFAAMKAAQQRPIKYLVLSGGGAKGAVYPGVYIALEDEGIIQGLEAVAGSSAGALTACFLAVGVSAKKFEEIFNNPENSIPKLKGSGWFGLHSDAKPLYNLLATTMRNNVKEFLDSYDTWSTNEKERFAQLTNEYKASIEALKQKCDDDNGKILFKDLTLLRRIAPERFKELVITAAKKDSLKQDKQELQILNSEDTPDLDIAKAAIASAALPFVFKSVELEVNGQKAKYVDGGTLDNIPTDYFKCDNNNDSVSKNNTMVLAFNEKQRLQAVLYSNVTAPFKMGSLKKFILFILRLFEGYKFDYEKTKNTGLANLGKNYPLTTIALEPGAKIGVTSFKEAENEKVECKLRGYYSTQNHLMNHELDKEKSAQEIRDFKMKSFIFDVLEKSHVNKASEQYKSLLKLCEPKVCLPEVTDIIKTCMYGNSKRTSKFASASSKLATALMARLNDPFTPLSVRHEFTSALRVDKEVNITQQDLKKFISSYIDSSSINIT